MAKRKGDGFLPSWFKRHKCPYCGKKGYYYDELPGGISPNTYRCMYCSERGPEPEE